MKIWEQEVEPNNEEDGYKSSVWCLAISRDNEIVISGGGDTKIRVWSRGSGTTVLFLRGHSDYIRCVAMTSN